MNPRRLTTRPGEPGSARGRRIVAQKYLEVAELVADEDGATINVAVGLAVLAGIAAADAICIAAVGQRSAGADHAAAAELLERVDRTLGRRLRSLVALKPASHYGEQLLSTAERTSALRSARVLVGAAAVRV